MLQSIKKHGLEAVFCGIGVSKAQLAVHLGRPYSTVCAWLNGYVPMPEDVEKKLQALVKQLKAAR